MDLTISFETEKAEEIEEVINNEEVDAFYIAIDGYHGELPAPATVTIFVGDKYADGTVVYLYYYNEETGKVEIIAENGVTVENGYVSCVLEHCSIYFLSEVEPEVVVTEEPVVTPEPTVAPTVAPTATPVPTEVPTVAPTATPVPTEVPTVAPTATPVPTEAPTVAPEPTAEPTAEPTEPAIEDIDDEEIPLAGDPGNNNMMFMFAGIALAAILACIIGYVSFGKRRLPRR